MLEGFRYLLAQFNFENINLFFENQFGFKKTKNTGLAISVKSNKESLHWYEYSFDPHTINVWPCILMRKAVTYNLIVMGTGLVVVAYSLTKRAQLQLCKLSEKW